MGVGEDIFDRFHRAGASGDVGAALFDRRDEIVEEERLRLSESRQFPLEGQLPTEAETAQMIEEQRQIDRESSTTIGEDIQRAPAQAAAGAAITGASVVNLGTEAIEALSRMVAPEFTKEILASESGQGTAIGDVIRRGTGAVAEAAQEFAGPTLSPSDRLARNVGEEAAASGLFSPPLRAGGRLLRAVTPIQKLGSRAARQPLGDFIKDEALSVVGTAAGRSVAEEAETGIGGELVLGTAGAVGAPLGVKVLRGAQRGAARLRGATNRQLRADEIGEELRAGNMSALINGDGSLTRLGADVQEISRDAVGRGEANRQAAEEMLQASARQGIAGDRFALSPAVDLPGVRALETRALSRNPEVATMVESRRDRGMKALADRMFELGGTPGLRSQDSGLAAIEMNLSRRLGAVNDEARKLVPEGLDDAAAGLRLSEETDRILNVLFDESVVVKDEMYRGIEDLAGVYGARWDPTVMHQARQDVLDASGRFEKSALPPSDLMDEIAALEPDGVQWADLGSLQRRVNSELANPSNSKSQNRLLGILRDGLSDTQDQMVRDPDTITFARGDLVSGVPGVEEILTETERVALEAARRSELVSKTDNANAYFRRHAQLFREGIAGKALTGNSSGPSGATDALLSKYLHAGRGGKRDAEAFLATFGKSPEALQNGKDYLIGEAYRATLVPDKDGVMRLSRGHLGKWLKGHGRVLALPEFSDVRRTTTDLERLATAAREIGVPQIDDSISAQNAALKKYLHQPDQVFSQIERSSNPIEELKRITTLIRQNGDEPAFQAFRRRFWDQVIIKNGRGFQSAAGENISIPTVKVGHIDEVLASDTKRAMIEELYSAEHVERLREISSLQRALEKFPTRTSAAGEALPTPAEDFAKITKRAGMFSVIFGPVIRVVRSTLAATEFSRSLSETNRARVIEEMIVNEEVAKIMLSDATESNVTRLRRVLGANVPSLKFRVGESEEFEEEDRLRRAQERGLEGT